MVDGGPHQFMVDVDQRCWMAKGNRLSLRVGVIGAGIMGADHVRTLHRSISGACVQAVADVELARAEHALASIDGGSDGWASADPAGVIADPRIDAVVIASSDATHADFVLAAVRAGKPVLCEKPLAPTLEAAQRLQEAVGADAGLVSLGFMRRFDPGYTRLKAAIDTQAVGRPLMLHCVSRGVSSAPGTTTETSVTNSLVHELDVVPWLLGSPVVQASWFGPTAPAVGDGSLRDPQLVLLRTADGVLTSCETFLNAGYGYDIRCEVVGETGAISLTEPVRVITDLARGRSVDYAADWRPRFADAYRLELQAWIDQISGRTDRELIPVLARLNDGVRAAAVAAAVLESLHHDGRPTDVKLLEDIR
jgi:myo-inositol 2-dehydrogenase / D-chiro-inositol 1-dehydrogenase